MDNQKQFDEKRKVEEKMKQNQIKETKENKK